MKTEGDDSVILVKDHKTLYSHGHAQIVLSQKLSRWLQIFVPEVRSRVSGATNDNDHHVFLSWNGESLASSQISQATKYEEDMPPPDKTSLGQQAPSAPVLNFTSNFPVPSPMKISGDRVTN